MIDQNHRCILDWLAKNLVKKRQVFYLLPNLQVNIKKIYFM